MKRLFFLSIAFIGLSICSTFNVNAQGVGISPSGSAPHPSAGLDVDFIDKGVLIPRVSLLSTTDVATIPSPALYLLIFNTNASITNGSGKGFYYWDGAQWSAVGGAATATPCSGAPAQPGPIVGANFVRANTTVTYMVPPVSGATTYTWSYTGTGATISGTTNPVSIYFWANATPGDLTVIASCGNGNSTASAAFPIRANTPSGSTTYFATGVMQTWQVPAGVYYVTLDVRGGSAYDNNSTGFSGKGGQAVGTLAVTPSQPLYIFVGRGGGGHFTGGGETGGGGSSGGGDASSVRVNGTSLTDRVIVAGGGGSYGYDGSSWSLIGGDGGGNVGGNGGGAGGATGGFGGTQFAGGAGGTGPSVSGSSGSLGTGGTNSSAGTGGGGGYYGGGGGGSNNGCCFAAGGGGSNYLSPLLYNTQNYQGVQVGNGQVTITF